MTTTTVHVLDVFVDEPDAQRYGLEVMSLTGFPSGTVFPILARLESLGWLESGWEEVDHKEVRRPARRYYRMTADGLESARDALARVSQERRRRTAGARTAPAAGLAGGAA